MKSKVTKIQQILMKGILALLILAMILPSTIYANTTQSLALQESTALEKLMYGEIGSVVRKIEEHFKSNTTLYIVNEMQLRALAEYVNNGNSCLGKNIELLNDITLSSTIDWVPIGNSYSEFAGTFNGNGYTISNLTYTGYENYVTELGYSNIGLFGVIGKSGIIKKVNINNSNIQASGININNINHVGNIVGTNYGKLTDCTANKMPLNKTEVDTGTESNNYIGKLIGENKGEEISTSIKQQPEIDFTVNDTKITGDFKVYQKQENEFVEITDFQNDINLKINDVIRIEYTLDKYLYTGLEDGRTIKLADTVDKNGNITEEIAKENYPQLKFAAGLLLNPIEVTQNEVTSEDGTTEPQTKLVYEYEAAELGIQNYENLVRIDFTKNINKENLYVYYSDDNENFNTGDKINITATQATIKGVAFRVDTKNPYLLPEASVAEMSESKRYPEGKEVIIKLTSAEKIQATTAPEIRVSFSESGVGKYNYQSNSNLGNAKHIDATINKDGCTVWTYSYVITPGDEGALNFKYLTGTITDLVGNTTDLTSLETVEIKDVYADTTVPSMELIPAEVNNFTTNKDMIVYAFKISEKVTGFTSDDITVNNGTKGDLIVVGDINADGNINTRDSWMLRQYLSGEQAAYDVKYDINLDGKLDEADEDLLNDYLLAKEIPHHYLMTITTNVGNGNVGDLQVIVEQNACEDLVGHGNVRTENVVRIDKKAPILLNLEAYGTSNILLNKEIDVVKENYKLGETITIIATFDENIAVLEDKLPALNLQFSQSGNAKGTANSRLEGNKIIYTYTITKGDEGTLSVKGFTGTVVDSAGNETKVTKRALDGDTIIADTTAPTLNELKVTTAEGTYKAGITIQVEAIYSEEVYGLENNEIKNIISAIAPTLKFKFGNGIEREAVATEYGTKEDGSIDKSKVIYTCAIVDGDNGDFSITFYQNKENVKVCDIAGNEASLAQNQTGNKVTADTVSPQVTAITASVENPSIAGTGIYHKEGNNIKITLTFNEEVSLAKLLPKILVGFSEAETEEPSSYNEYCYESDWNVNSTTIEYTYTIKSGDNGYLWVKVPEGQFRDIAGNTNIEKAATRIANVFADTTAPTITLLKNTEINQANQTITIKATFSEDVYDLRNNSRVSLTTSNAPKLIYSFGTGINKEVNASAISGATITYVITKDPVNDNGTLHYELAKGNLCDRAGNEYYQEKTDTTAPELEKVIISNNGTHGVYCKKDINMYVTAIFNEEIASQNMKLKVKLGDGQEKELTGNINEANKKEVVFTYTVKENDNGKLIIVDITGNTASGEELEDKTFGYVKDKAGNQKNIFNLNGVRIEGQAIADTNKPYVTNIVAKVGEKEIASYRVTESGIETKVGKTNVETIEYIITFSETVTGFTKEDITLANGTIKGLEPVINADGKQYKLTVYNTFEGVQSLIIPENACEDVAGNENTGARLNGVIIDFTPATVRFISEYNGGTYVLPTNIGKVKIRPNVEINEEIASIEYKWDEEEYATVENISSASDITIPTKAFTEAGEHTLAIKVIDIAGNMTEISKAYTIINSYINITPSTTEDTKEDIKVTVGFGEALTDNRKVTFKAENANEVIELNASGNGNNGTEYIIGENGTIYAEASDRVGNKVYTEYTIYNIDKHAPEIEISTFETDILTNVSVDAVIYTNENAKISYKWDNEEWKTTTDYTMNVDLDTKFTEPGEHTLYAKAVDRCGNESIEYSQRFYIKAIDFEVSGNPESWTSKDIELSVYSDTELASVKVMKGDKQITVTKYQTCIITENGDYVFTVTDKNGNTASKTIKVTKIDKKAPIIASATNKGRVITINSTDAESGVAKYAITSTTEVPVEWSDSNIISTTKDGTYYVWAMDNVGNIARGNNTVTIKTTSSDQEENPDIIFEDLTVVQKNGTKYVKISPTYTTEMLTAKMDEKALLDKKPEYTNLTSDKTLKTGTEIKVDGKTQYIVIVKGDINCDGQVDFLNDIVMINNYRIGRIMLNDMQILAGDINGSGEIEFIPDIVAMNNYRLGKIKSL